MFARASSSAYICVRCQRQLIQRTRLSIKPQSQSWYQQRWQSAGTAHVVDEDEDSVPVELTPEQILEYPSGNPSRNRNRHKRYRNRHWRPSPTADLGVDTLGKPAEVLILPAKQRKQSQHLLQEDHVTVHEKSSTVQQVGVQQSIAAELKPVSKDEAHKNINAVRKEIGQEEGYLRPDKFAKFRDTLCKGFTRNQLLSYMRYHGYNNDVNGKMVAALQAKREIANYIMTYAWGLESSQASDEVPTTSNLFANQEDIDLLLLDRMDELKRISRLRDVKIDVYRSENCIRLLGLGVDIQATVKEIKSLRARILRGKFEISPSVHGLLFPHEKDDKGSQSAPSLDNSILSTLVKKYKTILLSEPAPKPKKTKPNLGSKTLKSETLQRRTDVVRYVTFDSSKLAYIQRDLFMISKATQTDESTYPSIIDLHSTEAYMSAPTDKPSGETGPGMFRVVARDSSPNDLAYTDMNYDQRAKLKTQINSNAKRLLHKSIAASVKRPEKQEKSENETKRVEYEVEFGQASFPAEKANIINEESFCQQPSRGEFDFNVPRLPQWLARQNPLKARDIDASSGSTRTLIRLCFRAGNSLNEPAIEVFLTCQQNEDSSPHITIQRVSLLVGHLSNYILLPTHTTDIRLSRQDKVVIFQYGKPPDSHRLRFLSQLANYLNDCLAQQLTLDSLDFKPLLNIDLKNKINQSQLQNSQFFLESAYLVERSAYQVPGESSFALEYLSFEPLPSSYSQDAKQVLRLTREPLMDIYKVEGDQLDLEKDESIEQDVVTSSQKGNSHIDRAILEDVVKSAPIPAQTGTQDLLQPTPDQNTTQNFTNLVVTAYDIAVLLSNFGRSSGADTHGQTVHETLSKQTPVQD